MNFRWRLKECCQKNKRQRWDICDEFSMWHFVTKSTGLKSAKPGMSIHFSESGDPIYVGSAMWPECRRKDWRSKSCWLHPQESDPEVVQGPGSWTISPTSLGPAVVLIQGNWQCYWSWPTLVPPDVAASATLLKGKWARKWVNECVFRLTLKLSSYKIVFSLFGKSECRIQINKHIWVETCNFVQIG